MESLPAEGKLDFMSNIRFNSQNHFDSQFDLTI